MSYLAYILVIVAAVLVIFALLKKKGKKNLPQKFEPPSVPQVSEEEKTSL